MKSSRTSALNRSHIYRRINQCEFKRYDQIFPYVHTDCLRKGNIPEAFELVMQEFSADTFDPHVCLTHIENEYTAIEMPDKMATTAETQNS